MKKIASVFLFLAIVFSVVVSMGISVSADVEYDVTMNPEYLYKDIIDAVYDEFYNFSNYYEETETTDVDYDFIIEIDLSHLNINVDVVFDIFRTLFCQYPEFFFLDGWMSASYYPDTGMSASIYFRTAYHIDEIPEMIEKFEASVSSVLEEASKLKTDLDKILFVHNYIVMNTKYNQEVIDGGDGEYRVYTAYGVLVDRDAVCQGYAFAFNYLVRRLGIVSDYVISDEINHGWNIVKVGNYWYHLDATWDDPIYDYVGKIYYDNFLTSEAKIIETGHKGINDKRITNGTSTNYNVSSTRFDDLFLHNETEFRGNTAYHNGKWYFMMNANDGYAYICCTDNVFVTQSELSYDVVVKCTSTNDIPGLYIYEDRLYYTKRSGIYTCNFDGTDETAVYLPSLASGERVYGLAIREGSVFFNIEESYSNANKVHPPIYSCKITPPVPNSNATFSQNGTIIWNIPYGTKASEILNMFSDDCYITDISGKKLSDDSVLGTGYMVKLNGNQSANLFLTIAVTGDANGDALINGKDVIRLKKYLKQIETDVIYSLCGDINGDGKLTDADISSLVEIVYN